MTDQEPHAVEQASGAIDAPRRMTSDERKALLDQTIQRYGAEGWRIESRSDFQAVIAKGNRVNHVLHFLIGVITLAIWWIVWICLAIFGGIKRRMITIDEFGQVIEQKV